MSDKSLSTLQTVLLKDTGVICDLRSCFLLFIFLRKSLWSSCVPNPALPKQGTHKRHGHRICRNFVPRTAPPRGQRKTSLISWCQVIPHCRDGWLKGIKSKIYLKLGSSRTSSAANFSNIILEEKNHTAWMQLKRLKGFLGLFAEKKNT